MAPRRSSRRGKQVRQSPTSAIIFTILAVTSFGLFLYGWNIVGPLVQMLFQNGFNLQNIDFENMDPAQLAALQAQFQDMQSFDPSQLITPGLLVIFGFPLSIIFGIIALYKWLTR